MNYWIKIHLDTVSKPTGRLAPSSYNSVNDSHLTINNSLMLIKHAKIV